MDYDIKTNMDRVHALGREAGRWEALRETAERLIDSGYADAAKVVIAMLENDLNNRTNEVAHV